MKEISIDVPGDKVKLTRNAPPPPDNVKIVYKNNGQLLHVVFQYNNERNDGKEILDFVRQFSYGFGSGYRFTKEKNAFDGDFLIEGRTFHVFNEEFKFDNRTLFVRNMWVKNTEFHDADSDDTEFVLDMEMAYDCFRWDL